MRKIVADTNGLLLPFQFRLNLDAELERLFGSHEVIVPEPVLAELEVLGQKDRRAKAALTLARGMRSVSSGARSADDAVIDVALAHGACVLTNDRALLRRLKQLGIPRISLRSRSQLVLEGA